MQTVIEIDPNVRVEDGLTFAGFEDVAAGEIPQPGAEVWVRESEAQVLGRGRVERVDEASRLIYLTVDWARLERVDVPSLSIIEAHLNNHTHAYAFQRRAEQWFGKGFWSSDVTYLKGLASERGSVPQRADDTVPNGDLART